VGNIARHTFDLSVNPVAATKRHRAPLYKKRSNCTAVFSLANFTANATGWLDMIFIF